MQLVDFSRKVVFTEFGGYALSTVGIELSPHLLMLVTFPLLALES